MSRREEDSATPLDQAARAAWLYYVGGATQDQIAAEMGISRQRAQRLVAKAVAEGLIHVRLEHRVSRCMELERALSRRYGLKRARVALSLGKGADPVKAIAPVAAEELERIFATPEPLVVALGTGRTLRAMVEEMRAIDCPQHRIASLNGNMAPDGTASAFDVIMRVADKVRARHYPMPLPLVAATPEERDLFISLPPVIRARELAANADVAFVGVGEMGGEPPLLKDGFLTAEEIGELRALGAVGEITGWSYDDSGTYLQTGANARIAGVRLERVAEKLIVAIAAGAKKRPAIKAALKGGLVNGLITDEITAEALLA
ncbi:sugar-binding transcriptional regulator [uncultured Albimonas sp.]|uniref:sugar-binding transcriptional regulator n=1 Tax=uncultured Albimonas sp. TaxID=1331701 RepID=UPI0030ECE9B9|tara:strand:+ start:757 stop:1710 length:954 start_codon:yes stop_codon:yes gene_type:complete